jgi:hypothetical protein
MGWLNRMWVSNLNGVGGLFFQFLFTNPAQYRRVGLPGRETRDMARLSPHRHDVQILGFASLGAFLEEVGLMGPIARRLWRRSHFLPSATSSPVRGEGATVAEGHTDDVYDGPAVLRVAEADHHVRVRLTGHLDPVDGRYHWRGTVFESVPDGLLTTPRVSLTIGDRCVQARITERTPWGTYSVTGEGTPPFH